MSKVELITDVSFDPSSVLTVGTFDGVHLGHHAILDYLLERTVVNAGFSTVVTFDPHPREVLQPGKVKLLTTIDERIALFTDKGIDRVVIIPFSRSFSQISAEDFVLETLVRRVGMKEIVIGHDHHFGKGRGGNNTTLLDMAEEHCFSVDIIPAEAHNDKIVSSSLIRTTLEDLGDVSEAASLLGYAYSITASVVRGAGRGRTLGFPTANLLPNHEAKVIPADGVYLVSVSLPDTSRLYAGMMNIGNRPTFEGTERHMEVHIIDYDGDLYDKSVTIGFLERIRDEKKFEGIDALTRQLNEDRARCIASFEEKL